MTSAGTPDMKAPNARTILFVDDEPQGCKWFARLFADEFSILTAGSAGEALQMLHERGTEVAVLLTDFRMPVRDGIDLLTVAQRDHRHVVRLLATAYADKEVALAAINLGRVLRILEKPFDESQVRSALREALDIVEQRARERALLEGRAAAMRETLGFLAHELNTPLATVLGYMDAIKTRYCAPDPTAPPGVARIVEKRPGDTLAMIEAAERRTAYAMSLVATFVQSAREAYPGAAPAPVPASRLVATLLNDYPFEDGERAWVSCSTGGDTGGDTAGDTGGDFELPGQRDLLYLVLCTLTKNALMALRGGQAPRLHIALARLEDERHGAGQHVITFTDNGPGIPPDILARLTHEPVTTRAAQGGSGMGLLFCRRVVQSMGGLIEIHSTQGQGTCVTLLFKPETQPDNQPEGTAT